MVHPSVGLQLALLLGASWVAWALAPRATGVDLRRALVGLAALGLALVPWGVLYLGQAPRLQAGLPPEEFRLLSAELQNPQHMLPHLWRLPQWLAFGCYPILALLALGRAGGRGAAPELATWPAARTRLAILLAVNLAGIAMAWLAVEVLQESLRDALPTLPDGHGVPGACPRRRLGASRRALEGWPVRRPCPRLARGRRAGRRLDARRRHGRGSGSERRRERPGLDRMKTWARHRGWTGGVSPSPWGSGLVFLARHDTELGPWLDARGARGPGRSCRDWSEGGTPSWNRRRLGWALAVAWARAAGRIPGGEPRRPAAPWAAGLIERCRFAAVPTDDMERLALWCREHTPATARFIGPPGPKTFRLWSLRSLAFNRAASPYHAEGLADWAARFRDHVGFEGSVDRPRPGLPARPPRPRASLSSNERRRARGPGGPAGGAAMSWPARRRGRRAACAAGGDGPLELLHVEGRYAVYRVRNPGAVTARPTASAREQPQWGLARSATRTLRPLQ